MRVGSREERIAQLQERLGAVKRANDIDGEIDVLLQLGNLMSEDNPGGAHMHYKIAEKVISREDRKNRLHEAIGGQARMLRRLKRFDEAIHRYLDAERAAADAGQEIAGAGWTLRRASALRTKGDLTGAKAAVAEAENILRPERGEAQDLFHFLGRVNFFDPAAVSVLAELEGQIGLNCRAGNDDDGAETHYWSALEFARQAKNSDAVNTWAVNLGNSLSRRRRYTAAIQCYQTALEESIHSGADSSTVHAANQMAACMAGAFRLEECGAKLLDVARQLESAPSKLAILNTALTLFDQAADFKNVVDVAREIQNLSASLPLDPKYLDAVTARSNQAGEFLARSPKTRNEGPTATQLYLIDSMVSAEKSGEPLTAVNASHLVCDIKLALQFAGGGHWKRLGFGDILAEPGFDLRVFADTLEMLARRNRPREMLDLLQRYKSPAFSMTVLRRFQKMGAPCREAKDYLSALEALRDGIDVLGGPARLDYLRAITSVRRAGESVLEAAEILREMDPILNARMGGIVRPDELIDAFPAAGGVAVVDFVIGRNATSGVILLRNGNDVTAIPLINPDFTAEQARQLMEVYAQANLPKSFGPAQSKALAEISNILHDRFFCSLAQQLASWGITQLILIPDALTRFLPLHLARICGKEFDIPGIDTEDAEYLCEVMPVEFAPCLQAVAASQIYRRPKKIERIAGFADPNGDLPAARSSLEQYSERLPPTVAYELHTGACVTKNAVTAALHEADLLLFGTHGWFSPAHPENSYLSLYGEEWSMTDIVDQPELIRNPVLLLGACEIGAVAATPDEPHAYGIPGALIAAGAASVFANLWPVEDISAGYLTERFLHYLEHPGYRPAAALFRGVRDLRRKLKNAEALALCRRYIAKLEENGAKPRLIIAATTVAEWVEDSGLEHPFKDPIFWAAAVIVGSGWQLPAGAVVGGPLHGPELVLKQIEADDLVRNGKPRKAMEAAREIAAVSDGVFRSRALTTLCFGMLHTADLTALDRVRRAVRRILKGVARIALAEKDDDLRKRIDILEGYLEDRHVAANEQ
jgi:CHAT domain-containing protein